jgi:hypothetical protein
VRSQAVTRDFQKIRLQETPDDNIAELYGRVPRTVEVELLDDLVDSCVPGDHIKVRARPEQTPRVCRRGVLARAHVRSLARARVRVRVVPCRASCGRAAASGSPFTFAAAARDSPLPCALVTPRRAA